MSEDRREALFNGNDVDGWRAGSLLYADVSGFTALTGALARSLGLKRGAEALTTHLNGIYDVLIGAVGLQAGSVIGFSGDAITCWFDGDDGPRALSSAQTMQERMAGVEAVPLPGGGRVSLSIKAVVSRGEAYRCTVGDPSIQLLEVLAGEVVDRVAALEGTVGSGQILIDPHAFPTGLAAYGTAATTREGTPLDATLPMPARIGRRVRCWLLPQVHESLESGQGDLLTELRPCAALFLSFTGVDFTSDGYAADKLNRLVRHVQGVASARGGSLLRQAAGRNAQLRSFETLDDALEWYERRQLPGGGPPADTSAETVFDPLLGGEVHFTGLLPYLESGELAAGGHLMRTGEPSDFLCLIAQGTVTTYTEGADGSAWSRWQRGRWWGSSASSPASPAPPRWSPRGMSASTASPARRWSGWNARNPPSPSGFRG